MTRGEKSLLRDEIRRIIKRNQFAWCALKREIWDLGYQSYYEFQGDFLDPIERMLFNLHPDKKNRLLQEWRKVIPSEKKSHILIFTPHILCLFWKRLLNEQDLAQCELFIGIISSNISIYFATSIGEK